MNEPQPDSDAPQPQPQPDDQPTAQNVDANQMARFVTSIKNAEQQVGEHVIRALQHGDTVAVLTTVVVGPGGQQHIVSAALNPEQSTQVNSLLEGAVQEREDEEMCIGFHCLIKPKKKTSQTPTTDQK